MALNNYNDQNQKKMYHPTVYSPYKMTNTESPVDKTALTFTYWNSTLKLSIAPMKQNGEDISFDYENEISIYLSHTKARILLEEIKNFQRDPESYNSSGVPSGAGLITISNGKEFGVNSPCLVVRKVDEQGLPTSAYAYQFKTDYHYAIRNYDAKQGSFDKVTKDYYDLEIEQFKTLLEQYYLAMTGAVAYSVIDQNKYETKRQNSKLEGICEKLGVSFGNSGGYGKSTNTSVFNNSKPTNYGTSSLSNINSVMYDEE